MTIHRVWKAFFSPTGTTAKVVGAATEGAAAALGVSVGTVDFTLPAMRGEKENKIMGTGGAIGSLPIFNTHDLVFVGVPTYAGRVPNKLLPFFTEKLRGGGAKAVALVSYGNRDVQDSLAELGDLLLGAGFSLLGGGSFPCRHAFSDEIAPGRPTEEELAAASAFGAYLARRAMAEKKAAAEKSPKEREAPATEAESGMETEGTAKKEAAVETETVAVVETVAETEAVVETETVAETVAKSGMEMEATVGTAIGATREGTEALALGDDQLTNTPIPISTVEELPGNHPAGPYYKPLRLDGLLANFLKARPLVDQERCVGCGLCVLQCPMAALTLEDFVAKAVGTCIKCHSCIRKCPRQALSFEDSDFLSHKAMIIEHYASEKNKPALYVIKS